MSAGAWLDGVLAVLGGLDPRWFWLGWIAALAALARAAGRARGR